MKRVVHSAPSLSVTSSCRTMPPVWMVRQQHKSFAINHINTAPHQDAIAHILFVWLTHNICSLIPFLGGNHWPVGLAWRPVTCYSLVFFFACLFIVIRSSAWQWTINRNLIYPTDRFQGLGWPVARLIWRRRFQFWIGGSVARVETALSTIAHLCSPKAE